MIELNINRTRVGSLTISAVAIDDASGWTLPALVTAVVRSTLDAVQLDALAALLVMVLPSSA